MNQETTVETASWVVVARIVRPQGRRGEVLAEIMTDFPESFRSRKRFFLLQNLQEPSPGAREVELEESWLHRNRIVLKFAGINSISDAEPTRRAWVAVPRSEQIRLAEGAVYIGDLIGMTILDVSQGRRVAVGKIVNVLPEAIGPAKLEVSRGEKATLIPFAQAYLRKLDLDRGLLEMDLPEGLLDVDAPITKEEQRAQQDG